MSTTTLRLGDRSYPILIGEGLVSTLGRWMKQYGFSNRAILVVSQKDIASQHGDALHQILAQSGLDSAWFIPAQGGSSESCKTQRVFSMLIKALAAREGKNRSAALLAFGGGVVGDLTGFAAAVYRRGIPYAQIPTTLTAQVDSAIGGKTAIDLPEGKNLLGAVYQPAFVLSDTQFLKTLPVRYWSDGFSEVIKYGVILDGALFQFLEKQGLSGIQGNARHLERVIYLSARHKAHIVSRDERDTKGLRMILNFGHTAGHAIEAASRFSSQVTHGEAVAVGMLIACDIASSMGVLKDAALPGRLEKILLRFNLPTTHRELSLEAIERAMGYDKKAQGGVNCFVLPVALGKTVLRKDIPLSVIRKALQKRQS